MVDFNKLDYDNLVKLLSYYQDENNKLRDFKIPRELRERLQSIEEVMYSFLLLLTNKKQAQSKKMKRTLSKSIREKILNRDNHTCQNCEMNSSDLSDLKLHIDHIIPVSKGGTDEESNLQVLCSRCNLLKKNYIFNEYSKSADKTGRKSE